MKNYAIIMVFFAGIAMLLVDCNQKNNQSNVSIKINLNNKKKENIFLFRANNLNGSHDTISFVITDSIGKANINFNLLTPTFAYFLINDNYLPLYLSPYDDLQLIIDSKKNPVFKGIGAEVNNYLVYNNNIRRKFEQIENEYFFQLKPNAFLSRLDSLQKTLLQFHKAYVDSVNVSENMDILLKKRNEILVLYKLQNYALALENSIIDTNSLPKRLRNINNKIPLENSLIISEIPEYFDILHAYQMSKFNNYFFINKSKKEIDAIRERLPVMADEAIRKEKFPKKIEEIIMAKNIINYLAFEGISPSLDSVYNIFQKEYSNSTYLSTLKKEYNSWLALSEGKMPPDFRGITLENKEIALSELKGKIVYIDVWATWCGPCVEEFPYSKKIKQQFEENQGVVFMYVSVDDNKKDWQKFLKNNPDLKGVHINLNAGQYKSLRLAYKMWGIPQFMLIDQQGKIVSIKAHRPSSGKLEEDIKRMLKLKSI